MSTRSAIVQQLPDGTFRGIYCHSDGYPAYNGTVLKNHYTTHEKVSELIDLGDLSSLGKRVKAHEGEKHSYDHPHKEISVAYYRDRNEPWDEVSPTTGISFKEVRDKIDHQYAYLFKEGEWYLYDDDSEHLYLVKNLNDVK